MKKVLALAVREAKALNHAYVGTEHILLGLLREGDGVAGRVLKNLGVDLERTRHELWDSEALKTRAFAYFLAKPAERHKIYAMELNPANNGTEVPCTHRSPQWTKTGASRVMKWRAFTLIGMLMVLGILVALMLVSCIRLN